MKYIIGLALFFASSVAFSQSTNSTSTSDPLCVVDGKVMPAMVKSKKDSGKMVRAIDAVNPNTIDKIDVLNGEKAISLYGEAGKNGVILITLKKKKP